MLSDPSHPFSSRRFWGWYTLAWSVLGALYFFVFLVTGGASFAHSVTGAAVNVVPMALIGVAAVALFHRLDWGTKHRVRFVAAHLALGAAYGFGTTALHHAVYRSLTGLSEDLFGAYRFNLHFFMWESVMGAMIYGVLAGVCYAILLHGRMREQEARAARATALQTEAELRALRAQLNPHFLFNTLHSLLALVRHDPAGAEDALEQFGDLLRYTLDTQSNGEVVRLGDELAFVRNYLALESLRLGDRLRLDVQVDESVHDLEVPAFCLQPLVENAVRHGIAPRAAGGKLTVRVGREGETLRLEVVDDGRGADPSRLRDSPGLGLRLVRERLATHYGAQAVVDVDPGPGRGFRVTLRLPITGAGA